MRLCAFVVILGAFFWGSGCRSAVTPLITGAETECGRVGKPDDKLVIVHDDGSLTGAVEEGIVYFDNPAQRITWKHETAGQFLDIMPINPSAFDKSGQTDHKTLKVRAHSRCRAHKYTIVLSGDRKIDPVIIIRY